MKENFYIVDVLCSLVTVSGAVQLVSEMSELLSKVLLVCTGLCLTLPPFVSNFLQVVLLVEFWMFQVRLVFRKRSVF